MFEDETVSIQCPKCGFKNQILVHELEQAKDELHTTCESCKVGLKIDAKEFHHKLDDIEHELEEIEDEVKQEKKPRRSRKGDFQI